VHFSKDRLSEIGGKTVYGRAVKRISDLEWGSVLEGVYLRSLSQEHGIAVVSSAQDFEKFQIGDILKVLPVYSCMMADVMKQGYMTTDGEHIQRMRD
jgi:D-serine deaminase-like pyridoxal phosphate-dependent protein